MSRLTRPLRWILSSPTLYRRAASIQTTNGQTIILHRVRFNKKGPIARRINRLFLSGLTIYVFGSILLEPDVIQDAFIPFPLTTRTLEPQPYAGSDPEWQEFIRIAKDRTLQSKIRKDLVNLVLQKATESRMLTMRCGSDLKIRRYWMDLDYPYVAPPEYELSGLQFTEDAIEWTSKHVEPVTAKLLERVLWPRPMALSFWTLGTAVVKQKTAEIAKYLGVETNDPVVPTGNTLPSSSPQLPTSHSPTIQKALERMRQQATKRPDEVANPGSIALNPPLPPQTKTPGTAGKVPTDTGDTQSAGGRFWGEDKIRSAVTLSPWQVFIKKYAQSWKPMQLEPPRGCVAVSGLVELETSKSWLVVDVFGWYNPKTRAFDERSSMMRLRRLQHKQQSPLR